MIQYPKELSDALEEGVTGDCQSVVIHFKDKTIEAIEVIKEHQNPQSISKLLDEAGFQELKIKQHQGKCTYVQQKIKIRVNTQPDTNGKFQTCKTTQNLRSQSATDGSL